MKIIACGDLMIQRALPGKNYEGFSEIESLFAQHDFRFGNLETTIHYNEGYPACFPGGSWACAMPERLEDLKKYGFNVVSVANNHMMDYSHKGLEATLKYLQKSGLIYSGAGMTLEEASLPKYVECSDGRIALIAVTSSFHDSDAAGPGSVLVQGRPGINPLRRDEYYQVTPELYDLVKKLQSAINVNDTYKWSMQYGYMKENEELFLRDLVFKQGGTNARIAHPLTKDMDRISAAIEEARYLADRVVISIHSHQMDGNDETPRDFICEFAHNCIDAGADIILGHGSHRLRGLEIYKEKPIFYGLGDFIFHDETKDYEPKEFYDKYRVDASHLNHVGIGMKKRTKDGTRGLSSDPNAWESIAVSFDFANDFISLYPIDLQYKLPRSRRGWPILSNEKKILEKFQALSSEKYGTAIRIENDVGFVTLRSA